MFRDLDHDFAHLKAFSTYEESMLQEYGFSEKEYESYAAMYKNVMEEFRKEKDPTDDDEPVLDDYDLVAYHKLQVDFEYILELLQSFIESLDENTEKNFQDDLNAIRELIEEFSKSNPKLAELLNTIIGEIEHDKSKYLGQDISVIVNQMRQEAIDREVETYAKKWFLDPKRSGSKLSISAMENLQTKRI